MQEELQKALEVLKNGGVILYPTDTVWGIGCDASNEKSVHRIFEIKKRIDSKSMIVLLDQDAKINRYIQEVPDIAWDLVECAVEPLTIIYPGANHVAKNLIAEDGSLAIRITKDPFCASLIQKLNKPLVSTSANISGNPTPKNYSEISSEIISAVDHVVNLRQEEQHFSKPSSIIKIGLHGQIEILRR